MSTTTSSNSNSNSISNPVCLKSGSYYSYTGPNTNIACSIIEMEGCVTPITQPPPIFLVNLPNSYKKILTTKYHLCNSQSIKRHVYGKKTQAKSAKSSYLDNISLNIYSVTTDQTLEPTGVNIPVQCKDSILTYVSSNKSLDNLAIKSVVQSSDVQVFSSGTTVLSNKPNTKFLFHIPVGTEVQPTVSNLFTSMYWSYIILNPEATEEDALNQLEMNTGISNKAYNYFENDFYYDYAMQIKANLVLSENPAGVATKNYPYQCCLMAAQISFLWDVIYYYAIQQGLTVDPNFALTFYKLIYTNMNGTQVILTKALINEAYPGLIPENVNIDSTINYWVNLMNNTTNIVYLLTYKHVCDFFNILETGIAPLLENNSALLTQPPYNVSFYNISQNLTEIFNYIGPIYLQYEIKQNVTTGKLVGTV